MSVYSASPKDAKFCNVRDLRINVMLRVSIQGEWERDIIFIDYLLCVKQCYVLLHMNTSFFVTD